MSTLQKGSRILAIRQHIDAKGVDADQGCCVLGRERQHRGSCSKDEHSGSIEVPRDLGDTLGSR